jgi:hypothetical protein
MLRTRQVEDQSLSLCLKQIPQILTRYGAVADLDSSWASTLPKNLRAKSLSAFKCRRLLDLLNNNGDEVLSKEEIEKGRKNLKRFLDENDKPISKNDLPSFIQVQTSTMARNESHQLATIYVKLC